MMRYSVALLMLLIVLMCGVCGGIVFADTYAYKPVVTLYETWTDSTGSSSWLIKSNHNYYSYYSPYSRAYADIDLHVKLLFRERVRVGGGGANDYIRDGEAINRTLLSAADHSKAYFFNTVNIVGDVPALPFATSIYMDDLYLGQENGAWYYWVSYYNEFSFDISLRYLLGGENPFTNGGSVGDPVVGFSFPLKANESFVVSGVTYNAVIEKVQLSGAPHSSVQCNVQLLDTVVSSHFAFTVEAGVLFENGNFKFFQLSTEPSSVKVTSPVFDITVPFETFYRGVVGFDFGAYPPSLNHLSFDYTFGYSVVFFDNVGEDIPQYLRFMIGMPVFYTVDERNSGGIDYGGWTSQSCGMWDIPCHLGNALGYLIYEFPLTKPITTVILPLAQGLQMLFGFFTEFQALGVIYSFVILIIVCSVIFGIVRS